MMAAREERVFDSVVGKIRKSHDVGRSLFDVLSDIDHFCRASTSPEAATTNQPTGSSSKQSTLRPSPDRIWTLLTEHSRISVGPGRQFNNLTLADLWDHNGAALARIHFVTRSIKIDQSQLPTAADTEQQLPFVPGNHSSERPADQGITTTHHRIPGPANDPIGLAETVVHQDGVVNTIEPAFPTTEDEAFPVFDQQTPLAFDEQASPAVNEHTPETPVKQTTVRRSGRARRSVSGYTAEPDAFKSPISSIWRTSCRNTRSISATSLKPSNTGPTNPLRRARPSRIPPSLRPQVSTGLLPRQGSRKYLQGTEGFWNEMFWHARNHCEGHVTPRFTAGIATHPGARALYAQRPANIDEVILGAIEAGLPLPISPQDITNTWRDRTASVLKRSQRGVFISPPGVRRVHSSQYADHSDAPLCQILVLSSDRLREVDFSESERDSSKQLHTPSIPQAGFVSSRPTSMTGPFGPSLPPWTTEKNVSFMVSPSKRELTGGPPLGVFHHDENADNDAAIPPMSSGTDPSTPIRRNRKRKASTAMEIASPRDSISRGTTVSLESPEVVGDQHVSRKIPTWGTLPPPLTTRNRKRKVSGHAQTSNRARKRQKIVALVDAESSTPQTPHATAAEPTNQMSGDAMDVDEGALAPITSLSPEVRAVKKPSLASKKPREDRKEVLKQIILEVIEDCGGMIPGDYLCISDYTNQKWLARGKSGQPDRKSCKGVMKSLCTSGKLKRLGFTFQRIFGVISRGTMFTNVDVDATSEAVIRLQQNIINARPDLYVPPLGSVLDAPSIEAPPLDTPSAENISPDRSNLKQKVAIQGSRVKQGARKELLGPSPARRPFTWLGPPHHTPVQGSENFFALAFVYVAAGQSEDGTAKWVNTNPGLTEEEPSLREKKTISRKSQADARTRETRGLDKPNLRSPQKQGKKLNWRTERPVTTLTFDPEVHEEPTAEESAIEEPTVEETTSTGMPKFGRSSRGRKIIWKTRDSDVLPPSLPSSLQDVIDMPGQIPTIDYSMTGDPETNYFYWELDAVEYWETNILKIYQQRASDWTFINHGTTKRSNADLEAYTHLQWEEPNILTTATFAPQPTYIKPGQPVRKPRAPKEPKAITDNIDDESVDSDYDPIIAGEMQALSQKRRQRSSLQPTRRPKEQATHRKTKGRQRKHLRGDGQPHERQGRPRILQNMAADEIYRIVIAVIVVRTLAGGITGEIDWSIVQKLCPDRDEAFLADRWSTLIIRNRQDIVNLTESMQKRYILAYQKGEVHSINFDDVKHSDWEGIVSWAEQNLNKNLSDGVDALPSTRSELLRTTTFTFVEPQTLRDALAHTGQQLRALKEEILSNTPTAVLMRKSSSDTVDLRIEAEVEEEDLNLSIAKSWALSAVMTSEESLNATAVTDKLSNIAPNKKDAEHLFERAVKVLQRTQIIKRPRNMPRGPWRASERWFEIFNTKRMITATMLKKAAAWKKDVLDPAASEGRGVQIDKMQIMEDGEMVAIINMFANKRCKITAGPAGLPGSRYGLDPEAKSYQTKGMNRLLTLFSTTVQPTQEYVVGDPMVARRLDIPAWQDGGRGKIPCWIDMNGSVVAKNWEMVISAVVGLLSGRPGIQAVEIERSLGHGVTGWEVEMLLSWLVGSGFAKKTACGSGWETEEWWWMVCGSRGDDPDE